MVYGITAMAMGGLLVHFGQGPMQIEMHFYFFALIAFAAVYGNPAVIYVAAITVALHHLLLWMWLPRSVFNYDAGLSVVAVHAAFVVLESVAAALGVSPGTPLAQYLGAHDAAIGDELAKGWLRLDDGATPLEVAASRLPNRMRLGERHMELTYKPVVSAQGQLDRFVVMISDITQRVERERLEAEQKETAMLVNHMIGTNGSFIDQIKNNPALGRGQRETLIMIYQRFVGNSPKKRSIFDAAAGSSDDDRLVAKSLNDA